MRYGYKSKYLLLGCEGWEINHKGVCRTYYEEGLNLRAEPQKARQRCHRGKLPAATGVNENWSTDFAIDSMFNEQ